MNKELERLERLIKEDNVEELTTILTSDENLRNNFNTFRSRYNQPNVVSFILILPLLHIAVYENSQKVLEYLLSQDFVDKTIRNEHRENIYHAICRTKEITEQIFSIIERKVPHHLLLDSGLLQRNIPFEIACEMNNLFIVQSVHRILEKFCSKDDLISILNNASDYVIRNKDIQVIKYLLITRCFL